MKKLFLLLLILLAVTSLTNKLAAQNPIPSYDVPVVADPTTFEESTSASSTYNSSRANSDLLIQNKLGRGEKLLKLKTKDQATNTTAFADFYIYAIDATFQYGPFNCLEGTTFSQTLSADYIWGVRVIDASSNCEIDVWFE